MMRDASTSLGVLICALVMASPVPTDAGRAPSSFERKDPTLNPPGQTLSGMKVVIRVYKDCRADPRAFDRIRVKSTDIGIRFDSVEGFIPDLDESAVVVLAGADQDDDDVARIVGDFVYAESYGKAKVHAPWH